MKIMYIKLHDSSRICLQLLPFTVAFQKVDTILPLLNVFAEKLLCYTYKELGPQSANAICLFSDLVTVM